MQRHNGGFEGCENIVLTRGDHQYEDAHTANSLDTALALAEQLPGEEIWIAGGEGVYRESLPLASRLYLTQIHAEIEGDVFFPKWSEHFKRCISARESSNNEYRYTFYVYER